MAKKLDKAVRQLIVGFLCDKPNIPHIVARKMLEELGVKVSLASVVNARRDFDLPYNDLSNISRSLMMMRRRREIVTREYLLSNWPDIEPAYADYLIDKYGEEHSNQAITDRNLSTGTIMNFSNALAHLTESGPKAFVNDAVKICAPVASVAFSVSQMMLTTSERNI